MKTSVKISVDSSNLISLKISSNYSVESCGDLKASAETSIKSSMDKCVDNLGFYN